MNDTGTWLAMNQPALVRPLITLTLRLGSTALAWAATPSLTDRVIRVIDGDPIARDQERFLKLQREAREAKRGLWGDKDESRAVT